MLKLTENYQRNRRQELGFIIEEDLEKIDALKLGNLNSIRDWGHAADYCAAYQLMLEKMSALYRDSKEMMSYVVATDQCKSVRQFCEEVYQRLGFTGLEWRGKDENEKLIGRFTGSPTFDN